MNAYLIFGLGFFAQFLFFSRTVLQWFKSENEGESISPVVFWKISLLASVLMLLYGIFRNDFSIMLGQAIVYFIYVRNLQLKNAWRSWHILFRMLTLLIPVAIVIWLTTGESHNFGSILGNEEVPGWLLLWGITGQLIFTFRFVYQWIYSEKEQESVLPAAFWIISTIGAILILMYAIFRLDPVLFISNGLGLFIYVRNILLYRGKKSLVSRIGNEKLSDISRKISGKIR